MKTGLTFYWKLSLSFSVIRQHVGFPIHTLINTSLYLRQPYSELRFWICLYYRNGKKDVLKFVYLTGAKTGQKVFLINI